MKRPDTVTSYVAISEIAVPPSGIDTLVQAFRRRLGEVDAFDGFAGLEVLRDRRRPDRFLMITRWQSKEHFRRYMRSDAHRASHARIPGGPDAPRPAGFVDYDLVAD